MLEHSNRVFQMPSLKDSLQFSPSFFETLCDHFKEYVQNIEKSMIAITSYQEYVQFLSRFQLIIEKTSASVSSLQAINQIHRPMIEAVMEKLKLSVENNDKPETRVDIITKKCIENLSSQIDKFKEFMKFKSEFENLHKQFFNFIVYKQYLGKDSENNEERDKIYNILLNNYQAAILKFTFILRMNIRELDEAIFVSCSAYCTEISNHNLCFVNKSAVSPFDDSLAHDIIIKNNQKCKEADEIMIKNLLDDLFQYQIHHQVPEEPIFIPSDTNSIMSVGKSFTALALRHVTKGINLIDTFIPKVLNKTGIRQPLITITPESMNLNLDLYKYIENCAPRFRHAQKFIDNDTHDTDWDKYALTGYLFITGKDFQPKNELKNNKLLYALLDKKRGLLLVEGMGDKIPVIVAHLPHCLVVDEELDTTSPNFEIISHSRNIILRATCQTSKYIWINELNSAIQFSLSKIKYKLKDVHLSAQDYLYLNPTEVVMSIEGNNQCVDCCSPNPEWVNYHQGVTLCPECAGAHRHFGSTNNHVRSLIHDYWFDTNLNHMMSLGNIKVNSQLEKNIDKSAKPTANSSMKDRIAFVEKKYKNKQFALK